MVDLWTWLTTNHEVANALAAIFSAFTALLALFVSITGLWTQRRHDILAARPIPEITVADYENSLRVRLRNNGVGPLIVKTVIVRRRDVQDVRGSIIDWMPKTSRAWNDFSTDLAGRSLAPNSKVPLLELTQEAGEPNFSTYRDRIRAELRTLSVEIDYSDVYGTAFPKYSRSLEWFGRNLPPSVG